MKKLLFNLIETKKPDGTIRYDFEFNGFTGIVIKPKKPKKNNPWIYKTEFFEAFDNAENDLLNDGVWRVGYRICDMYGSDRAVRLMYKFYRFVTEYFRLNKKTILFGFSRGGLYAIRFSLFYPEAVGGIYLDNPVIDLRTWPAQGSKEEKEFLTEYDLNINSVANFKENPICNLKEFLFENIPCMVIAGNKDEVVPFEKNSSKLIELGKRNNTFEWIVNDKANHHPHAINIKEIVAFVQKIYKKVIL